MSASQESEFPTESGQIDSLLLNEVTDFEELPVLCIHWDGGAQASLGSQVYQFCAAERFLDRGIPLPRSSHNLKHYRVYWPLSQHRYE